MCEHAGLRVAGVGCCRRGQGGAEPEGGAWGSPSRRAPTVEGCDPQNDGNHHGRLRGQRQGPTGMWTWLVPQFYCHPRGPAAPQLIPPPPPYTLQVTPPPYRNSDVATGGRDAGKSRHHSIHNCRCGRLAVQQREAHPHQPRGARCNVGGHHSRHSHAARRQGAPTIEAKPGRVAQGHMGSAGTRTMIWTLG